MEAKAAASATKEAESTQLMADLAAMTVEHDTALGQRDALQGRVDNAGI